MSDSSSFELDDLLQQLATASRPDEAQRLGRLLLAHVFGKKDMMTFAEEVEHSISLEDCTEDQRRVLTTLATCNAAWPAIGFFIQESLELPFEPTQADLQTALAQDTSPPSENDSVPEGPPTTEEVLAAVTRLMEAFTGSDKKIARELERFERYRPHATVGVPLLVEQLQKGKLKQRSAAAWALGRLGPVARAAVPALLEAMRDWKNEYVPLALEEIGLDDYEPLLEMLRSPDRDLADRASEVLHGIRTLPADLVEQLLASPEPEYRRLAVRKLRFGVAVENLHRLIRLLDDADEDVAIQARYGLSDAGSAGISAILEAVATASSNARRLMAEALNDRKSDLAPHAGVLAGWLLEEQDGIARQVLLSAVAGMGKAGPEVVAALRDLAATETNPAVLQPVLHAMGQIGDAELVPDVITLAEQATVPCVRALGYRTLRSFREPAEVIFACLERALDSDSVEICLQAVWSLYYRGAEAVPILQARLNTVRQERVKAEIAWALGMLGADSAILGLRYLQGEEAGLASSVAGWAVETLEAGPCP